MTRLHSDVGVPGDLDTRSREIDALLRLAEELHEKCRVQHETLLRLGTRFVLVMFPGVLAVGMGLVLTFSKEGLSVPPASALGVLVMIGLIVGAGIVAVNVVSLERRQKALKKQSRIDERALGEIVELLREVESTLAKEADWSVVKRAEFRIRLSRFGIHE